MFWGYLRAGMSRAAGDFIYHDSDLSFVLSRVLNSAFLMHYGFYVKPSALWLISAGLIPPLTCALIWSVIVHC